MPPIPENLSLKEKCKAWRDAAEFRKRSDDSASFLRALIVAVSTGGIVVLAQSYSEQKCIALIIPFSLLCGSIAMTIFSWSIQKDKSLQRAKNMQSFGLRFYIEYNLHHTNGYKGKKFRSNHIYDGISSILLLFASTSVVFALPICDGDTACSEPCVASVDSSVSQVVTIHQNKLPMAEQLREADDDAPAICVYRFPVRDPEVISTPKACLVPTKASPAGDFHG